MALTFTDTHNMIAYLTKSDASEGFDQIIDFLNASAIKYALTKKIIIIEATIRDALRLDDVESIACLPNEEIFTELSRMGYEKPSAKLTFYKAFFSSQWKRVENLEQDKIAQPLEIIKLKQRVKRLEKKNKLKVFGLRRLKKVRTTQRIESFVDTIIDDKEDTSKQGEIIANIDADEDITLKDVSVVAKEVEQDELQEVIEVVTTAKLMTEVVTAATTPITTTTTPITAATITAAPNKGKGIMVQEPKPLKKQAQIEQDEAYARELEAELNKNINWDDVIEQMQRKEKEDNVVLKYQALKRKPQTKAQARKNMMIYLKNMAGFKMYYFKGMSYDTICPIFEKYFNSNVAFLEKSKEPLEEEESRAHKRTSESLKEKVAKKKKLDEEVEELKKIYRLCQMMMMTFIIRLHLLLSRKDLEVLWQIVKEIFTSLKPKNFSYDFLLTTLTYMIEKPDVEAQVWKNQRGIHGLAKVKSWRLIESCGVYIITFTTTQMILLVERRYPLKRFTFKQMLNNVRLEVEEESKVSLELPRFIKRQQQEGYRPE
nr:hypothetical protein [Tanacetum cinerariifolium]